MGFSHSRPKERNRVGDLRFELSVESPCTRSVRNVSQCGRGLFCDATTVWAFLVGLLLSVSTSTPCAAQDVSVDPLSTISVTLPTAAEDGTVPAGNGFAVDVKLSRTVGVGYLSVDVRVTSNLGPSAARRQLAIRLTPTERHLPSENCIGAELPVVLDQGSTEAMVHRAIPKWTIGNLYRVDVLEDGLRLGDYSAVIGTAMSASSFRSPARILPDEVLNNILFVDSRPINVADTDFRSVFSNYVDYKVETISLEDFPTDWRSLREVDCIVIDLARIAGDTGQSAVDETGDPELSNQIDQPDAINAIRSWVLMGGLLIVLNSSDEDQLSRTLNLSLLQSENKDEFYGSSTAQVVWSAQQAAKGYRDWLNSNFLSGNFETSVRVRGAVEGDPQIIAVPPGGVRRSLSASAKQILDTSKWLDEIDREIVEFQSDWGRALWRDVGFGQVLALETDSIRLRHSPQLLQRLLGKRVSSTLRRGVDPVMGDARHGRWLIPGVAEPPVYTFIAILTLFVLIVGPVSYRWTTRGHRSHLMFLIAPALALLTTVAMFTYSIIADGFGTTMRVRQLTWVDGASGDAVERTRSTLFAGISPRDGLVFPKAHEVLFYPSGGQKTWTQLDSAVSEVRLQTVVDDETQRFNASALPSRSQTQFVVHAARKGVGAVSMGTLPPASSAEEAGPTDIVTLSSTLGFELKDLIARSADGRYWSAERLDPGGQVSAKWIVKTQDSSKMLGSLYNLHRPVGATSRSTRRDRRRNEIRDLLVFWNRQISRGGAVFSSGDFELWLNDSLFIKGDLPPGTFVALSSPSDDIVPIEGTEHVGSVRYVMGSLR